MDKTEEFFRRAWYTFSGELWNGHDTYSGVPYESLPDVKSRATDDFAWLDSMPAALSNVIGSSTLNNDCNEIDHLDTILEQANELGISLPQPFVDFMENASLHAKVPTCTDCHLALSDDFVHFPKMDRHYFLRFLNDSQSCVMWYLWLRPDGTTGVVANSCFLEPDIFEAMEYEDLKYEDVLREALLCADNFTEFLYRFWIENTLWFSLHKYLDLTPLQEEYRSQIHTKL